MGLSLTDSGQLLADEHVDNARAAKACTHGDNPVRLRLDLADDCGMTAKRIFLHALDELFGHAAFDNGNQLSFVGNVQRVETQNLARSLITSDKGKQERPR